MKNIWKQCPGGRLSAEDLVITNLVSQEFFEYESTIATLIIAIQDEDDLSSGHKRKKAGDIIAVCPENHQGGVKTRKTHLLVKMDFGSGIASHDDSKKLMIPKFEGGDLIWPPDVYQILAKRRYNLPFTNIIAKALTLGITIDMDKLLNPEIDYQPLENVTIHFLEMVFDRTLNRKLTAINLATISNAGK